MKDLGAHAQRFAEIGRPDGHDHEFLNVERVVGVGAAIHNIHHRRRQQMRVHAAKIAPERHACGVGRRTRRRHRNAEDRVGAEPGLVLGSVEFDHRLVETGLVHGIGTGKRIENLEIDRIDGLHHALAAIAFLFTVAKLNRLEGAGRGTGWNGSAAEAAILEDHIHLDRRVAA